MSKQDTRLTEMKALTFDLSLSRKRDRIGVLDRERACRLFCF